MKTKAVSWILGPSAYGFAKDRLFWVSGGMRNSPRAEMPKNEKSKPTERPKTKISKYQNIKISKVSKYRREWGPGRGASEGVRSGLRESRRGDSPTGAGGTPEFPRGAKGGDVWWFPAPGGNLAGYRPPWGNHLDVIPGADLGLGFSVSAKPFSLSVLLSGLLSLRVYIHIYIYVYVYLYMCPARTRSLTRRARRAPLKDLPLNGG